MVSDLIEGKPPDPCWNRGGRLPAEVENLSVPAYGSKTGREKPLENRVDATLGKVNPKWP